MAICGMPFTRESIQFKGYDPSIFFGKMESVNFEEINTNIFIFLDIKMMDFYKKIVDSRIKKLCFLFEN